MLEGELGAGISGWCLRYTAQWEQTMLQCNLCLLLTHGHDWTLVILPPPRSLLRHPVLLRSPTVDQAWAWMEVNKTLLPSRSSLIHQCTYEMPTHGAHTVGTLGTHNLPTETDMWTGPY